MISAIPTSFSFPSPQLGQEETCKRIADMAYAAMDRAGLDKADTKLAAVGLSLSGCEREETNKVITPTQLTTLRLVSSSFSCWLND